MKIIKSNQHYLTQLVELFEQYRGFCGCDPDPQATESFLVNLMHNEASVIFIAVEVKTDRVMGFVNLYPSYSTLALRRLWILNDLGVSAAFRGRGVSKALIDEVMSFAVQTNAIRVELKTEKTNMRARQLYKTMGFKCDDDNVYYRVPCVTL